MDIKTQVLERLNSLYNFALDKETFDQVTFLGIGKKIQKIRFDKHAKDQAIKDNQLIEAFLSEYTNESHKKIARVLLENQLRYVSTQHPNVNNTSNMKNLLMGTAAKLIKKLMILDDIIGLQPMTAPVGQIFFMQYTLKDNDSDVDGNTNKQMMLEIVSGVVEAYSRKLQAAYTLEAIQDLNSQFGLDVESEFIHILSDEIMTDVVHEIIFDLMKLAAKNPITSNIAARFDSSALDISSNDVKRVMLQIREASIRIAEKTRRGPGNVIITSAVGASILQAAASSMGYKYVSTTKDERQSYQIGSILHTGNVVCDDDRVVFSVYATLAPSMELTGSDKNIVRFLIGYKGISATDTGYIYCPYVPIMSTGIIVNPVTFQPLFQMMTRYGKWVKLLKQETELETSEPTYAVHSSDYYVSIEIDANNITTITEK